MHRHLVCVLFFLRRRGCRQIDALISLELLRKCNLQRRILPVIVQVGIVSAAGIKEEGQFWMSETKVYPVWLIVLNEAGTQLTQDAVDVQGKRFPAGFWRTRY